MNPGHLAVLLATLLLAAPVGAAQDWATLSPAQKEALAPLATRWAQLDGRDQDTWAQLALRYRHLSAAEQQRLRERMSAWAALSPSERDRVRRAHAEAQRVPAEDRQARWAEYQALPAERKQALQQRAAERRSGGPASAPVLAGPQALDAHTLLPRRAASAP